MRKDERWCISGGKNALGWHAAAPVHTCRLLPEASWASSSSTARKPTVAPYGIAIRSLPDRQRRLWHVLHDFNRRDWERKRIALVESTDHRLTERLNLSISEMRRTLSGKTHTATCELRTQQKRKFRATATLTGPPDLRTQSARWENLSQMEKYNFLEANRKESVAGRRVSAEILQLSSPDQIPSGFTVYDRRY